MTESTYDTGRNEQDYAGLTIAELLHRLRLAENVCVMTGWTAPSGDTDRDKAAHQVWSMWAHHVGRPFTDPAQHPQLDAAEAHLAAERDRIRQETLSRLTAPTAQWWHIYGAEVPGVGWVQMVAGPTPLGPDDPGKSGRTMRETTVPFEATRLPWLEALNREPSDAEKAAFEPEGYRDV